MSLFLNYYDLYFLFQLTVSYRFAGLIVGAYVLSCLVHSSESFKRLC